MYVNRAVRMTLASAALTLLLTTGWAGTAAASTLAEGDVGANLGSLLSGLAQDLLLPTAGLFGLAAFFRRDIGHAVTILVIACIVGIFVYDAPGATSLITTVANAITGGTTGNGK
jgi:hypothetical protein